MNIGFLYQKTSKNLDFQMLRYIHLLRMGDCSEISNEMW